MYVEQRSFFISALVLNCVCFQQNHRIIYIVICYVLFKFTLSTDLKYLENMCRQQFSNKYDFKQYVMLSCFTTIIFRETQCILCILLLITFTLCVCMQGILSQSYNNEKTYGRPLYWYSYIKQYISANHNRDMYHYFLHKSTQANQRFTWFCIVVETKVLQINWKHTPIIQ